MKRNPYSSALAWIGLICLGIAFVCWLIGLAQQNSYASEGGELGWFAALGLFFPVGGVAIIAWLLVEAVQWRPDPDHG